MYLKKLWKTLEKYLTEINKIRAINSSNFGALPSYVDKDLG